MYHTHCGKWATTATPSRLLGWLRDAFAVLCECRTRLPLDPASQLEGMTHKIVLDATTPVPPDKRGNFSQKLDSPQRTDEWRTKLVPMLKELQK